nr:hypothetical protein CTI12_AA176900 [Tanacetum cinerariifolium]
MRKAYEKCNDIPQENSALIDTFLKQESNKDYEMHLAMYRVEESVDEHEIGNEYLTDKEQQQLLLDRETLRETLEKKQGVKKSGGERIRQEQAHDELFRSPYSGKKSHVGRRIEKANVTGNNIDQVFTINLHHDGIFIASPLRYLQGDLKQITDIDFEGIKELKTNSDVEDFVRVGYENKWFVDLYVEHFDYDVMDFINEEANGVLSDGSSDEYYSSDEIEEFDDVDFHTEREKNVVIKNLTTHDPFLNRLCGNNGMFRDYLDESVPETEGEALDDPDDAHIYLIHKAKKQALANYGVENGYQLWYARNDLRSLLVYCGRSVECGRCAESSKYAPKSSKKGAKSTKIAGKSVGKSTKSVGQCKRAKQRALYNHEGGLIEHYGRLWDYRKALLESNPGLTCRLEVEEVSSRSTYFKRFYICFKGLKDGWLDGYRRIIGLDGCFLKHTCRGELLTALGRDANNQMYPIAWAVVKVENIKNWSWFLSLLHDDLNLQQGTGLTLISDSHEVRLLDAVGDWLPNAEHKKCTRHVYANFKKKYSGLQLQRLFWGAALSTMGEIFYAKMDDLKYINLEAYEYLVARNLNS